MKGRAEAERSVGCSFQKFTGKGRREISGWRGNQESRSRELPFLKAGIARTCSQDAGRVGKTGEVLDTCDGKEALDEVEITDRGALDRVSS